MVQITLDLVRKRAEHNDMELSTLEEISLHQMDIERIANLQRWCPRLKILLLQGNLISKLENMNRFRELEYLNLALNNIERIEGLNRCEALTKLDLTANFIIYLTSLSSLQDLQNLQILYLTGNPCTDFEGYRSWVVNHLPQLQELDGKEIFRSERILSLQNLQESNKAVEFAQTKAIANRELQKTKYEAKKKPEDDQTKSEKEDDTDDELERWNNELTENSPEIRREMHEEISRRRARGESREKTSKEKKCPIKYFTAKGEPLNLNKTDLKFVFTENEEDNSFVLEVKTDKYLDSSLLTCDVQPNYVRVMCKDKPLQIVYPSEVKPDQSTAKRSQASGKLLITAPKVEENHIISRPSLSKAKTNRSKNCEEESKKKKDTTFLEFDESFEDKLKIGTKEKTRTVIKPLARKDWASYARPDSPGFQDDPEVPPLT